MPVSDLSPDATFLDQTASRWVLENLVEQHSDFVYAAALRQVRDEHLAADVTQAVLLILQKKMPALGQETIMTAWLLRTTRYTCLAALHRERRRRHHEQKAAEMRGELHQAALPDEWAQTIDAALIRLANTDRTALAGVYFEGLSRKQLAQRLGISEASAHKRVQRAVVRLGKLLARGRGAFSVTVVAGVLETVAKPAAAPAAVKAAIALSMGGSGPTAVTTLAKGAVLMAKMLKAKLVAMALGLGLAATLGVAAAYQMTPTPPQLLAEIAAATEPVAVPLARDADLRNDTFTAVPPGGTTPKPPASIPAGAPPSLQARYVRIFDSMDEKRSSDQKLAVMKKESGTKLNAMTMALEAQKATADEETLLRAGMELQDAGKQAESDYEAQTVLFTIVLWNRIEFATIEVRAKHSLSTDLPPNLPRIPNDGASQLRVLKTINARMVLELDDALEKEITTLLNDRYAKENPTTLPSTKATTGYERMPIPPARIPTPPAGTP